MYVKVEDVKEGCVLLDEVMCKAPVPLMAKNTKLTSRHIKILKAFLIEEISVAEDPSIALVLEKTKKELKKTTFVREETTFFQKYLLSVQEYKKEFQKWQSGTGIDITRIREIILPLLEEAASSPKWLFDLYKHEEKENYYYHHPLATGLLSGFLAARLNYDKGLVVQSALAGALADCGMAKISPRILLKAAALKEGEKKEVSRHPILSYAMVKDINLLKPEAKVAILQHHERMDGSGYVDGTKAEKLPSISRIVAVADVFHAMTADRLHKKRQAPFKVLEMFRQDFFGEFDLEIVKILTTLFTDLPLGTKVQLSDGKIAKVLFMKQQHPTRPLLQLETDETMIIDLEKRRDLYIEKIL